MSETINIYDAKTKLSQLVDRVAEGEEIIIARAGRPVARLVAFLPSSPTRKPGRLRGRVKVARDFDAPLPDELFESPAD
jgi:prevent-host-death family protein